MLDNNTRQFRLGYTGWLIAYYSVSLTGARANSATQNFYMKGSLIAMRQDIGAAIARMEASETI